MREFLQFVHDFLVVPILVMVLVQSSSTPFQQVHIELFLFWSLVIFLIGLKWFIIGTIISGVFRWARKQ